MDIRVERNSITQDVKVILEYFDADHSRIKFKGIGSGINPFLDDVEKYGDITSLKRLLRAIEEGLMLYSE